MRELDFLPKWYPELRTRKRRLKVQAWTSAAVVCGMVLWYSLCVRHVTAAQQEASGLTQRLDQAHLQLQKVDELMELQRALRPQDQVMESIGMPVEMTRILKLIEEGMTPQMGLVELNIDGVDRVKLPKGIPTPKAGSKPAVAAKDLVERKLDISVRGVAPSDSEIADFLHSLSKLKYLDNVAMSYARDRADSGHIMREFEITCSIDLNKAGAN